MPRIPISSLLSLALTAPAWAIPSVPAPISPGEQCRAAIAAAERGHAIPPQLLAAIGRVESGRTDPATGARGAWPWTINVQGAGYYFDSKAEAIAAVQSWQAKGARSIDVGCMQVNLMHHPKAFVSLDQAFEPAVNADYAATFLAKLQTQTGDWMKATANYHSANPAEGEPYAAKVAAIWPDEQRKAGLAPPIAPPQPPSPGSLFAGSFHAMTSARGLPPPPAGGGSVSAPVGRGLDAYRAMPVRMTMAVPPRLVIRH